MALLKFKATQFLENYVLIGETNVYEVNQGESLRIRCLARGDPHPQIWWSKVEESSRSLHRMVMRGDPNMLYLHGLSEDDSGDYLCQAKNRIGTAEVLIHIYVKCKHIINTYFIPRTKHRTKY